MSLEGFASFDHQHDFKPGMIVRERASCLLSAQEGNEFFVILELGDDEPLFDVTTRNETAGFGSPLNMVVGKADEDGDPTSPWVFPRRSEQCPKVLRR